MTRPLCLNASGRAGSAADADRLRAEGHQVMPFRGDARTAPVPGCVDGWLALHAEAGALPLDRVLAPAIGYATDGFPCAPLLAIATHLLAGVAGAGDLTDPHPSAGDLVRRPGVARALRAVAEHGRAGAPPCSAGRRPGDVDSAAGDGGVPAAVTPARASRA